MPKPLVIIAGWLGCKPRYLRRYVMLYEALGFETMLVIPKPFSVVEATFSSPARNLSRFRAENRSWTQDPDTVEGLSWKIIHLITSRHYNSTIVFHAFSNAGCFILECINAIINRHPEILGRMESPVFSGVVFDSCPAWFGDDTFILEKALEYCSQEERHVVERKFEHCLNTKSHHVQLKLRNSEMFQLFKQGYQKIPQLYIYCCNDPLASSEVIDSLIAYREKENMNFVMKRKWNKSTHCAHLSHHTADYQRSIADFTHAIQARSKL